MAASNLGKVFEPQALSRMGGAAQGGSAKPPRERERLDREHQGENLDTPPRGSDEATGRGTPASDPASGTKRPADPGQER